MGPRNRGGDMKKISVSDLEKMIEQLTEDEREKLLAMLIELNEVVMLERDKE